MLNQNKFVVVCINVFVGTLSIFHTMVYDIIIQVKNILFP